jgi:hypothetical protein
MVWGEEEETLDGTQLAADWTFSGLQKFGQAYLDRLRGRKLPNRLLEKVSMNHLNFNKNSNVELEYGTYWNML